jgi:hypothetical protein
MGVVFFVLWVVGSQLGGARRCPFGVTDGLRVLFSCCRRIQTVYPLPCEENNKLHAE